MVIRYLLGFLWIEIPEDEVAFRRYGFVYLF